MIKAVLIDAMSTIFRFKEELTKYEILHRLISELIGEKIPVERIKPVYDQKRAALEPREGRSHLAKWTQINKEIFLSLFPGMEESKAEELGQYIARKVSSDSSLYQVSQGTRTFLKEVRKRGIKVIIASNQNSECLNGLIKDFNLSKLLDRVYDSCKVGLEKPDPRFFQTILEKENLSPGECIMVGNNLKNDVLGAQKVGVIGVLLDPRKLYPKYKGYKISSFKEFWNLNF